MGIQFPFDLNLLYVHKSDKIIHNYGVFIDLDKQKI